MLGLIVRGLLIVASWVVAKDAPQFGLVQMAVGLLLMMFVVAVLKQTVDALLRRVHKSR